MIVRDFLHVRRLLVEMDIARSFGPNRTYRNSMQRANQQHIKCAACFQCDDTSLAKVMSIKPNLRKLKCTSRSLINGVKRKLARLFKFGLNPGETIQRLLNCMTPAYSCDEIPGIKRAIVVVLHLVEKLPLVQRCRSLLLFHLTLEFSHTSIRHLLIEKPC